MEIDSIRTIPADELSWKAVRASGPGGQNVNKVSSKVELRFDLARTRVIDNDAKARLRAMPGVRLDSDGWLILVSQVTRDQPRNLEDARRRLRDLIVAALVRPKKRRPTKPKRGAIERRLTDKKRASAKKSDRRTTDY